METTIKELGEIITGNTPSKKELAFWDSDDICFVKPDDIADEGITLIQDSSEYLSENARLKARIVAKDAVFVTCIGSIGKIGIASKGDYAFNQQINAIVTNDKVLPRYLAYNLLFSKPKLVATANAPVVPIINKTQFGDFRINIEKSLDKQEQIVDTLDKISGIVGRRKRELEELDNLIKARFVEMFGDPLLNLKGLPVKTVEEVAVLIKAITYSPEDVADQGMIVLRSSNIRGNEFDLGDLVKITKRISSEKYVHENDILMCNRNGSARLVGKVALIPKLEEDMTFGTFMTIVRSDIYEYLFAFFQMDAFKEQIKFQTAVAINQISLPLLASVRVPIPPREQIEEFSEFKKQVDKSKFVIQKSLDETQLLFDSLMQQYFA